MVTTDSGQAFKGVGDWKHITLGDIASEPNCLIQTGPFGSQLHKHEYQDHGVGVVNPTHLSDNRIAHDDVPHVSSETANRLERHRLAPGDILFARRGEIGRHGLVSEAENGWLCGTGCFLVRIRRKDVDNHFLSFFLATKETVDWLNRHAAGVVMPNLSNNVLHRVPIALPPVAEQRKIAGVLGLVQRAMEQQDRLIALTTELKKALLHQLFTHGLRGAPQKETEIGTVPESWDVVRLGDVAKLESGGTPARDNPAYWNGGCIPWVKTGEIAYRVIDTTEEMITREGLANSAAKIFPNGTLLVAMYGQGVTRGRVGLLGIDAATNQACAAITPRDEQKVSTRFIYHFLEFHYEDLRQMGHGANQRNLNAALIKGFRLSFPKPDEQAQIVEALGILNAKLMLHQTKHAALTALFRTLLHQLMTAQIRVDKLDIEEIVVGIS